MIAAVNDLVSRREMLKIEVAYIRNEFEWWDYPRNWFRRGAAVRGTPGTSFDPRVLVMNEARIFSKGQADAFSNSDLDGFLRDKQVDHVVLAGVFADACVYYTAEGALNRGYRVTVLRDAVAAATDEDRDRALASLEGRGVGVMSCSAFMTVRQREQGDRVTPNQALQPTRAQASELHAGILRAGG
jgi:nicotinamidase-related amidase